MSNLPTNYVDDVLNADVNTRRKYQMIQNGDGTVSLVDVTDYDTVGSSIGAAQINAQNTQINQNTSDVAQLSQHLTAQDNLTFKFASDEGNHGYLKGDGTFAPFSSADACKIGSYRDNTTINISDYKYKDTEHFVVVPTATVIVGGSNNHPDARYYTATLSISNDTLTIGGPYVMAWWDQGVRTNTVPYDVYYLGKLTTD